MFYKLKTTRLLFTALLAGGLAAGCGSGSTDRADLDSASEERVASNAGDTDESSEDQDGDSEPPDVEGEPLTEKPKPAITAVPTEHSDEDVAVDLGDLNDALAAFMDENEGRVPTMKQLVSGGFISKLPPNPKGRAYFLDKNQKKFLVKSL